MRSSGVASVGGEVTQFKAGDMVGMALMMRRKSIAGSGASGIAETQEMLDFCAEHGITCDVAMIKIQDINEAYEGMLKSDGQIYKIIPSRRYSSMQRKTNSMKKEVTRRHLLDAAANLVDREGGSRLPLDALAQEAGVSKRSQRVSWRW